MITKFHSHVKKYHKHYLGGLGILGLAFALFAFISGNTNTIALAPPSGVIVTPATNGTDIPHYKAADGTGSAYTTLGTISISSSAQNDFKKNESNVTLILTAPTNWKFNAGIGSAVATGTAITLNSITVTSGTITLNYTRPNTNSSDAGLIITGIQVQAISGNAGPSTGYIYRTVANPGTATIAGITNNSTNFGTLSQTAAPSDITPPTLAEVTPVPTPSTNTTPNYTFSSNEAGTISYSGGCTSVTTGAISGNNTVTFNALAPGTYSVCKIQVTDAAANASSRLPVTAFTINASSGVTVTPASNGTNIPISQAANGSSPTRTALGNITIDEQANTDFASPQTNVTLILTAPSNRKFRAGSGSASAKTPGKVTIGGISVTDTTITVTLSVSNDNKDDIVYITGIRVQAINSGNTPSLGYILRTCANSGTVDVLGAACSDNKNFGTLSQAAADTTPPTLAQVTAVPSPTKDTTPNYTFSSNEAGTITYGGDCSSASGSAISGNNTITFNTLSQGTHSNCTITVTDAALNASTPLSVNSFTIDTTAPVIHVYGSNPTYVLKNSTYTDAGAYRTDNYDGGPHTGGITTGGSVNTSITGTYYVTYSVSDTAGNTGTGQRTVNVVDIVPPTYPTNHYHSKYNYSTTGTTQEHGAAGTGETGTTGAQGGSIEGSTYSDDLNNAYLYMYDIGLITAPTIQEVNMGETFTRADMAKLMVDYAINILNKTANTQAICNFNDIANESPETQTAIISACQLGLMGIDMMASFYPDLTVDQAQAGTILSRILWGDTYNGADPFYLYHLNALKEHGIISSITPDVLETMESFMLMLYKASL